MASFNKFHTESVRFKTTLKEYQKQRKFSKKQIALVIDILDNINSLSVYDDNFRAKVYRYYTKTRGYSTLELREFCKRVGYDYWANLEIGNTIDIIDTTHAIHKKPENEIKYGKWYFHVYVSKDSPNNPNRGFWTENTRDSEYWRGHFVPGAYLTRKEAIDCLLYYQSGYVFKKRHNSKNNSSFWTEEKYICELNFKSKDYRLSPKPKKAVELKQPSTKDQVKD